MRAHHGLKSRSKPKPPHRDRSQTRTIMKKKPTNKTVKQVNKDSIGAQAFEVSFPQEEQDRLLGLLRRFGGDAVPEEAATKLSATAMLVSNIASGHMLAKVDGVECEMGMDFLVEGGMVAVDFSASVIAPALRIQDRWERNLLHDPIPEASGQSGNETGKKAKMWQDKFDTMLLPASRARLHFSVAQNAYHEQGSEKNVANIVAKAENRKVALRKLMPEDHVSIPLICNRRATLLREATGFPFFLSRASGMAGLRSCAARAHLGHLIVHSPVESPAFLEKLRKNLEGIGERDPSKGSGNLPTVRMNLALIAPLGTLDGMLAAKRNLTADACKLLWLVESSPGCELPEENLALSQLSFSRVCEAEIMRRINFEDEAVHKLDALDGHIAKWRVFLRERERHLPGIAATAWNLPVALCYGLEALLGHKQKMDGADVIAFSKWLVLRMCNRFAALSPGDSSEDVRPLAGKLAGKLLEHGPMTGRELSRCFHGLKNAERQPALDWLSEQGVAACKDGVWGVVCDADVLQQRIG